MAEGADRPSVVALAGGVGGAKLAHGLQAHLGERLTVVVNTGDDTERHGLLVMPDHDTVMYTLAGLADPVQGWGIAGETFAAMEMLERYGEETWFRLGDRDLGTHIVRTRRLAGGERLTGVCLDLQESLGVRARILPMTDDAVRTEVRTDDGWLDFQEYFVRRHQEPEVRAVRFRGADEATATDEVRDAIGSAAVVVVAPSNPIVSIGPILAVPGVRQALATASERGARIVAVSGIVGGKALKGPADRMLTSLGHESSALGVARLYTDWIDTFVLDQVDAALQSQIEALGLKVLVTDTIMSDDAGRARLAGEILSAVAA
ncbi:MAG TPA: 2-phospho-L-lactate transferase [Candidatus Limnocylindrales bacterium]|jgi:LPPG:FO 2-phospho-L-lactate transferase|nr:2-phospho-L-lactate transferase [Candidatus Limnocylindrales bacterium]